MQSMGANFPDSFNGQKYIDPTSQRLQQLS